MEAYLRFRVPPSVAESLYSLVDKSFPLPDQLEAKSPDTYHVTLAHFGDIHPASVPVLNDAVGYGCLKYAKIRPIIRLERFAVFKAKDRRLLVVKAEVTPFAEWNSCRDELLRFMGIDPSRIEFPAWKPHVTLGELKHGCSIPAALAGTYMWEPAKVEMVFKTKSVPLILPAWSFD